MQYTQAQIDRANAVSLEDFLRTQGETLIKSGREYRWKEHDSLTVRGNKWFRHSQSKGGYPIDFVMEFYGKSLHFRRCSTSCVNGRTMFTVAACRTMYGCCGMRQPTRARCPSSKSWSRLSAPAR